MPVGDRFNVAVEYLFPFIKGVDDVD